MLSYFGDRTRSRLTEHDRLTFVGDSITYFGGKSGGYVDRIEQSLIAANLNIPVNHYGLSGARAADLWTGKTNWSQSTPYRDILTTAPTILIIYIGVNDVWHEPATAPEQFRSNLTQLVVEGQAIGAIVIVATPAVIGENLINNANNQTLEAFSQITSAVAIATDATLCNLRQAFVNYLQTQNTTNRDRGILTSDGVHMNAVGNQLIADCMVQSIIQASQSRLRDC
jgi:lysophospholipase L1-like esterase